MNTDNLAHQFTEELKDKMLRAKRNADTIRHDLTK